MSPEQIERLISAIEGIQANLNWISFTLVLMLIFKNMGLGQEP